MSSPRHNKFFVTSLLEGGTKLSSPRASETKQVPLSPRASSKYGGIKEKQTSLNSEKVRASLENYTEVPESEWHNMRQGAHIRYLKKDGEFKPGGFIKVKNEDYFMLSNSPINAPGSVKWAMHFKNVAKIFIKNAADSNEAIPMAIPNGAAPAAMAPVMAAPVNHYDPLTQVENGFAQNQFDDLEKKVNSLEANLRHIQNDIAELTIFVKKIGKYIQTKGIDVG